MKKIIVLCLILLSSTALASTERCHIAGGHCVEGACPEGEVFIGTICDDGSICCVAKTCYDDNSTPTNE